MSKNDDDNLFENAFHLMQIAPIWVGPLLAFVTFALFRWFIPLFIPAPQQGIDPALFFRPLLTTTAWVFGGLIIFLWVVAELLKPTRR